MKSGIYKIWFNGSIKCYIGSSKYAKTRLNRHLSLLRNNSHDNIHLQRAYNKHGVEKLKKEIIEFCEESDLLIKEQHYIDSNPHLYNICRIAGNCSGVKHSKETNRKKARNQKGENNNAYGKPSPFRKKIVKLDLNEKILMVYNSMWDASQKTGISRGHIRLVYKQSHSNKTAHNFIFKYYDDIKTLSTGSDIAT